jgi:hypothetical protein
MLRLPAARRAAALVLPPVSRRGQSLPVGVVRRFIVIDRTSFNADELRRAPKTGQTDLAGGPSAAETAPIPTLRAPVPEMSVTNLGDSDLREQLAECLAEKEEMAKMSKELDWTRERLMSLTEEASQVAAAAPVDTVPRDVYKQLEADVQKLQQQNLRMHLAEEEARSAAAHAVAEAEELRAQLAAAADGPAAVNDSERLEYELGLAVSARDEAMACTKALEDHVADLTFSLEAAMAARGLQTKNESDELRRLRVELEHAHAEIDSMKDFIEKPDEVVESMASTLEMSIELLKTSWIDIDFRHMEFREVLDEDIDILAGVGGKTSEVLHKIGVTTVRDLATLPAFCSALKADPADASAMKQPVDTILDPTLTPELRETRLAGLTALRIRTVGDMRSYKFALWANAILELAPSERRFTMHLHNGAR